MDEPIEIMQPSVELRPQYLAMLDEYSQAGELPDFHAGAIDHLDEYLQRLQDEARGIHRPPRFVPESLFWMVANGDTVIGESRLLHRLTPWLEVEGGHIGYAIRPSYRCHGYGTLLLKLTLEKAREIGLERVFLTCDTENVASRRIIETNGGKLQGKIISGQTGRMTSQYWIDLAISTAQG